MAEQGPRIQVRLLEDDEVLTSAALRPVMALLDHYHAIGGQPSWAERGRYPAEVRAVADAAWEELVRASTERQVTG